MAEQKKTVSEIIEEMRRELREEDDPNAELFAPYMAKKPGKNAKKRKKAARPGKARAKRGKAKASKKTGKSKKKAKKPERRRH